ncbi:MAG: TRAP transporter small permease [Thiothrix sp.]|nr:TRAP transporter small permease [Thiothrix sp.]HPQ95594.1 TRAP transporter small permease [Thiolinea sp.]
MTTDDTNTTHPATGCGRRWADARPIQWAVRASTALSVLSLAILLLVITASVVARYVFAAPLLGSNEILQLCLVAMVALAMLPAAHGEQHIRVDVLDAYIGKYGRYAGDLLSRLIAAFVLYALAYRSGLQALDAAEFGDATNMLAIPLWPFYALIVLGAALYATMLVIQVADLWRCGVNKHV